MVTDANGYWLDLKDLFVYGDQFVNFARAGVTNGNFVDLPTAALNALYPDSDDITGLFVPSGTVNVSQDGVVALQILGAIQDTTPVLSRLG